jgi:hypothetical protein
MACSLPFLNLLMVSMRRIKDVSAQVQLPTGAKLLLLIYLATNVLTLVLVLAFPDGHRRHRFKLFTFDRTYRLVSFCHNCTSDPCVP